MSEWYIKNKKDPPKWVKDLWRKLGYDPKLPQLKKETSRQVTLNEVC